MAGRCCRSKWTSFAIFVTGAVLVILGCTVKWGIFPKVLNDQIDQNLELTESNTDTWDAFVSFDEPSRRNHNSLYIKYIRNTFMFI